jgi:hypothetical protein
MEIVFKRIKEVFEDHPEVFSERTLPAIRTIDIHLGQPDNPEEWEVFCPAIFVAWNKQPGPTGEPDVLTLDFHILQEPGIATDGEENTLDPGLEYLRLIKACNYLLNRLKADNTSPLEWKGERQAITQFFRYHIVTYTCQIDTVSESIHDKVFAEGKVESIKVTGGKLKQFTDAKPVLEIETYG